MIDEPECINRAKSGHQKAFRMLYDEHVEPLYRFMRQYSRDSVQVEEWVQRAFIKAFRNIAGFNGSSRFSTWLFTIALNEMRSDVRRPNLFVLEPEKGLQKEAYQREDDSFIWNESMKVLLEELDTSKRTVFTLFEVEGYSHAEIASILKIGENSSRVLLHRAKQYLQSRWKAEEKSA